MFVKLAFVLTITFIIVNGDEKEGNALEAPSINYKLVSREDWGARQPSKEESLQHPIRLVIIAHTASKFCSTVHQCSQYVKNIQDYHLITLKYPDISYNFLIGGDGNVYEGRGWDTVNPTRNNSITVAFLGNFLYDYLSKEMISACQDLLTSGVKLGKLEEDFGVVAHNQTKATHSPGENVYNVIKQWPQFQEGKLN